MKFIAVSTDNEERPLPLSQNILATAVFDVLSEGANSGTGSMLPKAFQRIQSKNFGDMLGRCVVKTSSRSPRHASGKGKRRRQ
jgi:hypothetical protein